MSTILNTLVVRLADYVEFDAALWNPTAVARLDSKKLDMAVETADRLWERVCKAAGLDPNDWLNWQPTLPWQEAEAIVAERDAARVRLMQRRREQQEELRLLQSILAQEKL